MKKFFIIILSFLVILSISVIAVADTQDDYDQDEIVDEYVPIEEDSDQLSLPSLEPSPSPSPNPSPEPPAATSPTNPDAPTVDVEKIPSSGTAVASTQTVTVDGQAMEFQMYALVDAKGNRTNYIKLRDMAQVLNGTAAQFSVGYDNASKSISVTSGEAYTPNGTEMTTPFSGDRAYTGGAQTVHVNGFAVDMTAITLVDDVGGGYTYFKVRDLGVALGFNVGYSSEQGVYIESNEPYTG